MMSRHFALSTELTGAIAKRVPHAKNQLSAPGSFFNQFVTGIYNFRRSQGDTADTQCPQAAQRKQAKHACIN